MTTSRPGQTEGTVVKGLVKFEAACTKPVDASPFEWLDGRLLPNDMMSLADWFHAASGWGIDARRVPVHITTIILTATRSNDLTPRLSALGKHAMTTRFLSFGETLDGYAVPVLNERAVRASAGILFVAALVSFMNAWLLGNFQPTRVFVLMFLADFTVRIFVNPKYSPSFIIGQWIVRKQRPDYVGAPQKRFAWAIGFTLALIMSYLVVIKGVVGPLNILVCAACLTLMFFETSFGICLGCKVYNWFHKEQAQLCPGDACEVDAAKAPRVSVGQVLAVLLFIAFAFAAGSWASAHNPYPNANAAKGAPASESVDPAEAERCTVPEFAKQLGHEAMWKLHNNCK